MSQVYCRTKNVYFKGNVYIPLDTLYNVVLWHKKGLFQRLFKGYSKVYSNNIEHVISNTISSRIIPLFSKISI